MQIDHSQGNCRNPGCSCAVPQGDRYCGDHCRKAAQSESDPGESTVCVCGHDACANSQTRGPDIAARVAGEATAAATGASMRGRLRSAFHRIFELDQ